jgi:hypothetical protein
MEILHNYIADKYGVLSLKDPKPFTYDITYVETRYDSYGWQTRAMSLLRLHYIRNFVNIDGKSILDVGYGNGDFLDVCFRHKMYTWGYDINEYPLKRHVKKANNMFDQHYDIITFFDSLEHFKDIDFVKNLDCKYICISVPWCLYPYEEPDADWFANWKHLRPEEHFHHFSRKALKAFMADMGFKLVDYDNIEDSIRGTGANKMPNILTAFFTKGTD